MKFKSFLLAAAAMLFAVACNETPEGPVNPETQVAVMPLEVSYVANGGENAVSVVAKGAWTATPSAEWITVSPASGEAGTVSVKVTAAKNEVTEAREGVVTFAVGTEKAELKVKQAAGVAAGSEVWGIAGTHQGDSKETQWKPENAPAMAYADGYYSQTGVELKAGDEFKFVKDKSWAVNRGLSGSKPMTVNYYYAVRHDGANIKVAADGTYDIYLNADADTFYLMEAGKLPAEAQDSETLADAEVPDADKGMRIVGIHNGWNKDGEDVNMTLTDGLWAATGVTLDKTGDSGLAEFKFVKDRTTWYGVAADTEIAVNHFYTVAGENIKVAAGTYDLYISEDATKFYVMAPGVAPSEAQDGEAAPAVEASIEVGEVGETLIFFNVTTSANVTAAAWYVTPTDYVDEELTAEYILEGGFELYEDELGATVELAYRRASSGTEYTIFLAYETANGVDMVSATATTTGNANIAFIAESVDVFADDLYDEYIVTFSGEEYEVVVWLDSANIVDKDFYFEDSDNIITKAIVKDVATGDEIDDIDIEAGEFSVYYAGVDNIYYAGAYFIATSGIQVVAEYEGPIEGLGGGAAVGGDVDFTVASATITPSEDYANDPSVWYLELTSTTGDMIGLTIDTDFDEAPLLFSGMYGLVRNGAGIYMYDSWAEIGGQNGMFIMPNEEEGLMIQTTYDGVTPETDMYMFQGVLTAYSTMTGQPIGTIYIQSGVLSCYGNNGGEEGGETEGPVATMDYWGGANFMIYIPNGDTIVALDCYAGTEGTFEAGLPTGTYTVTNDYNNFNMTIHAGYELMPGYPFGAHVTDSIGVNVLGYINQGTLEVVNNGDGTYKFTFAVCDDNWTDYAGTYEGAVEATDYASMYGVAPKKAARVAMK